MDRASGTGGMGGVGHEGGAVCGGGSGAGDTSYALVGLDDVPWAERGHAYGAADDVPGLLRALAAGDDEAAAGALDELYGCILHQGTVYSATAEAVPFLARIAADGRSGADVLVLLGGIAESTDEHGVAPGTCRAAVAAQLPTLLALTGDPDADVRRAAVWAVGHTAAPAQAWPALERRWAGEEDATVRAELVTALIRLDPARGAAHAVASLAPEGPPGLRVTAVLACLAAGLPWDGAQRDAVLGSLPADGLVSAFEQCEPLQAIVGALLRRDTAEDREAASPCWRRHSPGCPPAPWRTQPAP
ncbi:HEAT repeat domain-containing protein [Streptomyces sp. NPDC058417]|uniref:HEAT repeat domain-containing protein n=1 Tax=unclassified Streptomyces TaxID=2593676 RepID=UPI003661365A